MTTPNAPSVRRAPWGADEVSSLLEYQQTGVMHPFTCPNRNDGGHELTTDLGVLVPTATGWACASCAYTQDWAHDFMLDGSWRPQPRCVVCGERPAEGGLCAWCTSFVGSTGS
jgi:hypothetical protein